MELLIFFLAILTVGSIIVLSMIAFKVATMSLIKIKSLEDELLQVKNQSTKLKK